MLSKLLQIHWFYVDHVQITTEQSKAKFCDAYSSHHFWQKKFHAADGGIWLSDGSQDNQVRQL